MISFPRPEARRFDGMRFLRVRIEGRAHPVPHYLGSREHPLVWITDVGRKLRTSRDSVTPRLPLAEGLDNLR